jgi:hypothetical protein
MFGTLYCRIAVINWSQNSTHLRLPITLQTSSGTPLDLTGISANAITLKVRPASQSTNYTNLTGTSFITSAGAGQITYKFSASDVAVAGHFKLVISVSFGVGDNWNSFEQDFVISQTV